MCLECTNQIQLSDYLLSNNGNLVTDHMAYDMCMIGIYIKKTLQQTFETIFNLLRQFGFRMENIFFLLIGSQL